MGVGGYGMGMGMGMGMGYGHDPNDPHGMPQPPPAWQRLLGALGGVVGVFGKIAFLVDENTQAVHFFISALLQLIDRFGSLYSELVRFVLRMLGWGRPGKGGAEGAEGGDARAFSAAWQPDRRQ